MSKIIEWVKSHPYITGAIVLIGIILIMLLSGGGSSSATGVTGKSSDEIESDKEIALAQIAAASADKASTAELTAAQYSHEENLAAINAQNNLAAAQLKSSENIAIAEMNSNYQIAQLQVTASAHSDEVAAKAAVDAAAASKVVCKSSFFGLFKTCK